MTLAATMFTASGLINGDTVTSVAITSAGATATAGVSGSPYAVIPSAAVGTGLSNYTILYGNGTLTVNPAPLTIAANDATEVAGQSNPTFTVQYRGFVLGQDPGVLSGTLTFSTPVTPITPTGSYPIVPGGLTSSNYVITYVDGTLTVNAAPLVTITSAHWQSIKVHLGTGKKAKTKLEPVLDVQFSGPLAGGETSRLISFGPIRPRRSKRRRSRPGSQFGCRGPYPPQAR